MTTQPLLTIRQGALQPGVITLLLLMAATRFDHFGSAFSLPDASVAIFFMAGLWFGGRALFLSLLIEAALIDTIAISQFGVSDFCISPAYVFLVPAYGAVWFAGVLSGKYKSSGFAGLAKLFGMLLIAVTVAFVISNGSFYLLSDKFTVYSWETYLEQSLRYYPPYLIGSLSYSVAMVLAVSLFRNLRAENRTSSAL